MKSKERQIRPLTSETNFEKKRRRKLLKRERRKLIKEEAKTLTRKPAPKLLPKPLPLKILENRIR